MIRLKRLKGETQIDAVMKIAKFYKKEKIVKEFYDKLIERGDNPRLAANNSLFHKMYFLFH